jgi:hypothetical protein
VATGEFGEQVTIELGQFERLDPAAISADDVGVRLFAQVDTNHALGRLRPEGRNYPTATGGTWPRRRNTSRTGHRGARRRLGI